MNEYSVGRLKKLLIDLRVSLERMEHGDFRTHDGDKDTTTQSIEQMKGWIADVEGVLVRADPGMPAID